MQQAVVLDIPAAVAVAVCLAGAPSGRQRRRGRCCGVRGAHGASASVAQGAGVHARRRNVLRCRASYAARAPRPRSRPGTAQARRAGRGSQSRHGLSPDAAGCARRTSLATRRTPRPHPTAEARALVPPPRRAGGSCQAPGFHIRLEFIGHGRISSPTWWSCPSTACSALRAPVGAIAAATERSLGNCLGRVHHAANKAHKAGRHNHQRGTTSRTFTAPMRPASGTNRSRA